MVNYAGLISVAYSGEFGMLSGTFSPGDRLNNTDMNKTIFSKTLLVLTSVIMLQACDSAEDKTKKMFMCGIAVNELGNRTAKENFDKNRMVIFDGKVPDLSSYDVSRIAEEAREELGMHFPNHRENAKRLIDAYEENYCVDLHKVPQTEQMKLFKKMVDY